MTKNEKIRVRMVGVLGDQEDFADLIGTEGTLSIGERHVYQPENRGDWLTMEKKRVTEKDGKISVATRLGNTFIFRRLSPNNRPEKM